MLQIEGCKPKAEVVHSSAREYVTATLAVFVRVAERVRFPPFPAARRTISRSDTDNSIVRFLIEIARCEDFEYDMLVR